MSLRERLSPFIAHRLVSVARRDAARAKAEAARRKAGEPHRVYYFHQPDDPYAVLAAQVLARFASLYDIELVPMVAAPPGNQDAPQPEALAAYARRDAAAIAPAYGLTFADPGRQPDASLTALANAIAVSAIKKSRFVELAPSIDAALWAGDANALEAIAADVGKSSERETQKALRDGARRRKEFGHYLGGTFCYAGEQYWGIDRLHYLEQRLADLGAKKVETDQPPITEPPAVMAGPPPEAEGPEIDFFLSLRSPYTAISAARFFELADHYNCPVNLRYVLPMMMRGIPASREKQKYIPRDAKREGDRVGAPFGRIADPFGKPSERGLSIMPYAIEKGRGREYVLSFLEGVWAEQIPAGSNRGLRKIVERAGLDWAGARKALDDPSWRETAEVNREALFAHGLWGVPSFAVKGQAHAWWGQDRLWLVERDIRAAMGLDAA